MSILEPTTDSTPLALLRAAAQPERRALPARKWLALAPIADGLVLALAVAVERIGGRAVGADGLSTWWIAAFPVVTIALLASWGLYRERLRLQLLDDLRTIAGATAIAAMATIALPVLAGVNTAALSAQGVRLWLFATVYLTASRAGIISSIVASRTVSAGRTPTLIVGAGSVGRLLAKRLMEHREIGLAPIGFLDKEPLESTNGSSLPVLGASWDLGSVLDKHGVQHVVFTFSKAPHEVMLRMLDECTRRGVRVTVVPRLFERIPEDITVDYLGGIPLLTIHQSSPTSFGVRLKYAFDRVAGVFLLLVTAPLMLATALAVRLSLGRPILYRQMRVGRDGRTFEMLKFRTMRPEEPAKPTEEESIRTDIAPGGIEGADRRTRLGTLLRCSSIDELPQLLNVVRGDMSLVGPRPERPLFADVFRTEVYRYNDRHRMKSGITGWAQISGLRGQTSLADRVEWDNWYIENWSPWLDVKILLRTALAVVRNAKVVE